MSTLSICYHLTGKRLTLDDAIRYDVIAAGFPDAEGVLLFDSDEALYGNGRSAKELPQYRQKLNQLQGLNENSRSRHLARRRRCSSVSEITSTSGQIYGFTFGL
jgi:hypothetical protein